MSQAPSPPLTPTMPEDDSPPQLRRSHAMKRPRSYFPREPGSEEDDDSSLDLGEFFDRRGTARTNRVAICRSYASYLVSLNKK